MNRAAIFVDAGYLFAQGSVALCGAKQPRSILELDAAAVVGELKSFSEARTEGLSLLRIYWYDGAVGAIPSAQQLQLAELDDLKLRLGAINSEGQQKGVDSLIVTDLIDLSRNRSISDAVLLSGDEDVRVGVQVAQTFGVRVHLLGIVPSRGSQSRSLRQEADTTTEWGSDAIERFLSVRADQSPESLASHSLSDVARQNLESVVSAVLDEFVSVISPREIADTLHYWTAGGRGVPQEFDRRLLAICRRHMKRDLDPAEKRLMRKLFEERVRSRSG